VPCHRVLASNKRITGYSGGEGIPTKAWLLRHEGVAHK
jgi:methylated-DNA-[protein]-cysteine S-methyltransferase